MATRLRPRPRPSKPTATQRAEQETLIEHEPQQKQQAAAKAAVIPAATMITAKQSTEMLQTAMHAALSALAYLRNWFPVHCFDDIIYMSADAHWSYRDYASGEVEPSTLASSHRTPMRVMRRGRSTRVDQLLDWLEKGVFDALQKGYLRAMQISIFQDPDQQSNVLESYTFTVNYAPPDSRYSGHRVTSIDIDSPRGSNTTSDIMSVQRVRGLMQGFVRQVMASTSGLDLLIDDAHLRMHLYYTEESPDEYEPAYFKASTDTDMFFPDNGFVKTSANVKGMRSGYHAMSFKISHLNPTDIENNEDDGKTELPRDFQYKTRVRRQDEIESDDYFQTSCNTTPPAVQEAYTTTSKAPLQPTSKQIQKSRAHGPKSDGVFSATSTTIGGPISPEMDMALFASAKRKQVPEDEAVLPTRVRSKALADSTSVPSLSPGTQDMQIIQDLQNMIPPSAPQNFTQDTQRVSDLTQDSAHSFKRPSAKPQMQLLQSAVDWLEKHRSVQLGFRKHGQSVRVKLPYRNLCEDGEKIRCECGGTHEDRYMLFCSFCNSMQHIYCYGFHSKDDTKLLGEYACYTCLLEKRDTTSYMELRSLAIRRRGIHIIEERGYLNDKDFNSILGCNDVKWRSNFITQLKKKGILINSPGHSKKKGKKMAICEPGEVYDGMIREFFDPYTKVENYYKDPLVDGPSSMELDEDENMTDTLRALPSGMKRVRGSSCRSSSSGPRKRFKSSFSHHHLNTGEYTPSANRL